MSNLALLPFMPGVPVAFMPDAVAWAAWVSNGSGTKFVRDLDPGDPSLAGRVLWLVAADGGFPPGWLDGYERETSGLFKTHTTNLPIVKKGS